STPADFTNEIEKEEVIVIKAYLRQAIANFAAADSPPSLPRVPMHTRPYKRKEKRKGNDINLTKIAVATPRIVPSQAVNRGMNKEVDLPNIPQTSDNTWAIEISPAGICEVVIRKLSISPTLIGKIKPVRSGFALSPSNTEARDKILNAGNWFFLIGAILEAATKWASVLIPTVPAFIRKEQGEVEVSNILLADEVERVCSVRPAHLKLYGGSKARAPHRTWMALFSKAPSGSFKVFDESGNARPFKKQKWLDFSNRCKGHHPTKNCSRAPSFGNCGSTNHTEDLCMAGTKCRNCGGPHRSDSRKCLARPTRSGAPTKEQMKTIRQIGEREFHAVLLAKATKESTASENNNIDLTNSHVSEIDGDIDNITTTPFENFGGGAMRL
ncbi:hypothetical protein EPUL_006231, partial [Erysiphe pulchra]